MKLSQYFEKTKGRGIMATADAEGNVSIAVYARPHFIDEETVAFIMADKLMHKNLQANPQAAYLFMEDKERYVGKRLYLTKIKEEKDKALIDQIRRKDKCPIYRVYKDSLRYLVYFHVDKVLPLPHLNPLPMPWGEGRVRGDDCKLLIAPSNNSKKF